MSYNDALERLRSLAWDHILPRSKPDWDASLACLATVFTAFLTITKETRGTPIHQYAVLYSMMRQFEDVETKAERYWLVRSAYSTTLDHSPAILSQSTHLEAYRTRQWQELETLFLAGVTAAVKVPGALAGVLREWRRMQAEGAQRHAKCSHTLRRALDNIQILCGGISSGVDELLKVSVEILSQTSLQSQMDRLKTIDNILLDTCAIHDSGRNSNRAKGLVVAHQPQAALSKHRPRDDSQRRVRRLKEKGPKYTLPNTPTLRFLYRAHQMGLTEASLCVVRESALLEKSNGDRRPTWTEMEEILPKVFGQEEALACKLKSPCYLAAFANHLGQGTHKGPNCTATFPQLRIQELCRKSPGEELKKIKGRCYLVFRVCKEGQTWYRLSLPIAVLNFAKYWKLTGIDSHQFFDYVFHMGKDSPIPEDDAMPEFPGEGIPWSIFRRYLNHKFQQLVSAAHGDALDVRPISDEGLRHIGSYVWGVKRGLNGCEDELVFEKRHFYEKSKYTGLRLGEWFYCVCFILEKHLFTFWNNWLIWDFMQKEECRRVLKERKEPAAIIKFSDTMMGCLIIAFYSPKNKEVDFLRLGLEQLYEVRLDQAFHSSDLAGITHVFKAYSAELIPIRTVIDEGRNQRDYYKNLLAGRLAEFHRHPYAPMLPSQLLPAKHYSRQIKLPMDNPYEASNVSAGTSSASSRPESIVTVSTDSGISSLYSLDDSDDVGPYNASRNAALSLLAGIRVVPNPLPPQPEEDSGNSSGNEETMNVSQFSFTREENEAV